MVITTIMAAAALAMGSLTGSAGVGAFAATPSTSASGTSINATPTGKHDADGCGRKSSKHAGWCSGTYAPSIGGGYGADAPDQASSPADGGYVSAPAGQAVSPIVGGYASAPAGQAISPVGGGYASTPPGEAIAPVG